MPRKKIDPLAKAREYYAAELDDEDFVEPVLRFLEEEFPEALEDPENERLEFQFEKGWSVPLLRIESGHKEFYLVLSEDDAYQLAHERVKQDLENEPEIFNQSWLEGYIDTENLKLELMDDVTNMAYEDLVDENDRLDDDDEDKLSEEDLQEEAERRAEGQLRDPIGYLEDIYGREDAVKEAMRIAGIDIKTATDDAISADGVGHFLSTYDGDTYDLPGGAVYWRHN
jgi:hypothetical protein